VSSNWEIAELARFVARFPTELKRSWASAGNFTRGDVKVGVEFSSPNGTSKVPM
jgi:hypothetical protein